MTSPQIYILIGIIALAGIMAVLVLTKKKMNKPLTPLSGLAFGFIIAGMIFGENRLVGYGLMGFGVALAVVDMVRKLKDKKDQKNYDQKNQ
ncbi:MAG: LPXTG cell wall anchor domain-containing protein [Candidatus Pacebacteria bacterium]|nr:LPXTG cell wall anchor domain-containing protein [Candidatus Paceibacterota bacterium]MDD5555313.1 LPXTG cell wall anchor domain-containing protein [Candidatus Paceibacterota bacterium]